MFAADHLSVFFLEDVKGHKGLRGRMYRGYALSEMSDGSFTALNTYENRAFN